MKPALSVVCPVYNESGSLPEFHDRLLRALRSLGDSYEIIYVNDGSRDSSLAILKGFAEADERVKLIDFSRNFGHQLAITAGMDHTSGEAAIVMDTDGQDPPELIPRLVEEWRAGYEVVYAVRSKREGESIFKKLTAKVFYRLMGRMARIDIPLDAGDFRLMDRRVIEVLRGMRETHRFIRGMTAWVGFRYSKVEYVRKGRLAGQTNYPFWKMFRFAIDGLTAFSHTPLRLVTFSGLLAFAFSVVIGFWVLYVRVFNDQAVRGWTSLMGLVLFMGGMNLIALGVIGEYLARIFDEVKGRPLYIVRERLGVAAPEGEARLSPR